MGNVQERGSVRGLLTTQGAAPLKTGHTTGAGTSCVPLGLSCNENRFHRDGGWAGRGRANLPVFAIAVELSCVGKEAGGDAPLHCLLIIATGLHAHTGLRKEALELLSDVAGMHQPSVVEEVLATPLRAPAILNSKAGTMRHTHSSEGPLPLPPTFSKARYTLRSVRWSPSNTVNFRLTFSCRG